MAEHGRAIYADRTDAGISRERLAKALGMREPILAAIEGGRKTISARQAFHIHERIALMCRKPRTDLR